MFEDTANNNANSILEELAAAGIDTAEVKAALSQTDSISLPESLTKESAEEGKQAEATEGSNLFKLISEMKVAQKIKLALLGNKAARAILINDTSKQIPLFVLQNPGVTVTEVAEFAGNKELGELVFRAINNRSAWMKNYEIQKALVGNPKVPVDISMRWIKYLMEKDLRIYAKSKNIPQLIATQCRKTVERRQKK